MNSLLRYQNPGFSSFFPFQRMSRLMLKNSQSVKRKWLDRTPTSIAPYRCRFAKFVREELAMIAARATDAGHMPLSEVELDAVGDTVVALLAHHASPAGVSIPRERLIRLDDQVLMVLMTGSR